MAMGFCQLANTKATAYWKRLAWQRETGGLREGETNYAACGNDLCYSPEHIGFREKLTRNWNNWKPLRERVRALTDGEYFDVPEFRHADVLKMRAGLAATLGAVHFITRNIPGSRQGVRIIRVGEYYGDRRGWEAQFPVIDKRVSILKPWQRPTPIWLGQDFTTRAKIIRPPKCSVRNCPWPTMNGAGEYCYHHNHWYDFGMTMHDTALDAESMFNKYAPTAPYELAAEFPHSMRSLERSLLIVRAGHVRHDHKNAADTEPMDIIAEISEPVETSSAKMIDRALREYHASPVLPDRGWRVTHDYGPPTERPKRSRSKIANYSRSSVRAHMRLGGGSHSSSKTTRGRAKAASRSGPGSRHSTKEKRWSRETIDALEREADRILGIADEPAYEYNFIPEEDRDGDDMYEVTDDYDNAA